MIIAPSPAGRRALAATVTGLFVLIAGCSQRDDIGRRYPVTGTVTYKGKPLPTGHVNFVPEGEASRGATGNIVDGKYRLTTHAPDDGAMPGKYRVTITAYEGDLAAVHADANKQYQSQNAMPDQTVVSKAQRKSLIPEKYGRFEGSGLTAEVKEQSNTIDFDLKD